MNEINNIQYKMRSLFVEIKSNLDYLKQIKHEYKTKVDNSLVTQSDILVNSMIIDSINSILHKIDKYYTLNLISEELHYDNTIDYNKGYTVIIDPIDGTENFFSGMKEWGICICLYKEGKHLYSTIMLPDLNIFIDSEETINRFNKSRIIGLSSSLTLDDIKVLAANKQPDEEYRIIGCAAYNLYNYIIGAYKRFENVNGVNTWDISAGLNIMLNNELIPIVNGIEYTGELLLPNTKYKLILK